MTVPGDFEVRDPEAEEILNALGNMMRGAMPSGMGFVLLIADFGENGATFYTSNCQRRDVCNMMREFIQKNEMQ